MCCLQETCCLPGDGMSLGNVDLLFVCVSTGPVEECRIFEVGSSGFSYASCLQSLPFICRYRKGTASGLYLFVTSTAFTPGGPSEDDGQSWGGLMCALKTLHTEHGVAVTLLQLHALRLFCYSPVNQCLYT